MVLATGSRPTLRIIYFLKSLLICLALTIIKKKLYSRKKAATTHTPFFSILNIYTVT